MTNVLKALAQVQNEIENVVKVKRPGMQYKVVMYDDLLDAIREEVLKAGLTLVPHDCLHVASTPYDRINDRGAIHMNRDVYVFTFRIYHVPSGEYLQLTTPGDGVDEMDKGPGKALTYATKTAWEKLLMLARGDQADPDGRPSQPRQVSHQQQQGRSERPPAQQPPASQINHDIKTWPKQYADMFTRDAEAYVDTTGIDRDKNFNWLTSVEFWEKRTAEMNMPADVRYWYIRGMTSKILRMALESERHRLDTVRSVKENKDRLKKLLGETDLLNALYARCDAEEAKAKKAESQYV